MVYSSKTKPKTANQTTCATTKRYGITCKGDNFATHIKARVRTVFIQTTTENVY